jgi:hypothetical protein
MDKENTYLVEYYSAIKYKSVIFRKTDGTGGHDVKQNK